MRGLYLNMWSIKPTTAIEIGAPGAVNWWNTVTRDDIKLLNSDYRIKRPPFDIDLLLIWYLWSFVIAGWFWTLQKNSCARILLADILRFFPLLKWLFLRSFGTIEKSFILPWLLFLLCYQDTFLFGKSNKWFGIVFVFFEAKNAYPGWLKALILITHLQSWQFFTQKHCTLRLATSTRPVIADRKKPYKRASVEFTLTKTETTTETSCPTSNFFILFHIKSNSSWT